uniref:Uncharacterized protein n=1 Tax=Rhizophora mucronata TaxID=61149 RepID=A0A2P2P532_RHIMU
MQVCAQPKNSKDKCSLEKQNTNGN